MHQHASATHVQHVAKQAMLPAAAAEVQLEEREKELGIVPDPTVAGYMAVLGKAGRENLATDIALKALGLEGCADTVVVSFV